MNKLLYFLLFSCLVIFTASEVKSEEQQNENILKISSYEVKSSEIISIAVKAINRSFENISKGIASNNFPDTPGPRNMPFPTSKKYNYNQIYGYSFEESNPRIVEFLIGFDGILGLHIAVVIDLEEMKALKVYNVPGS